MQAVVPRINRSSAVQIVARRLHVPVSQHGLRRAQLVPNLSGLCLGRARVGVGRLLLVAFQFVGVTEIGQNCRRHFRCALQGCNRRFVIVLFAVIVRCGLEDLNVAGRVLLGLVEHLFGAVRLF